MKKAIYIFSALAMLLTACSKDSDTQHGDGPCAVSVSCPPMVNGRTTRASVWDNTPSPEYPEQLAVVPSEGEGFTINKSGDADNTGYVAYHTSSSHVTDINIKGRSFRAYAPLTWNGETASVPAISTCDYLLSDPSRYEANTAHLFFELKHATALLRFCFKVDEKYDRSRLVLLKGFKLNGTDIAVNGNTALLSTTMTCEAICYVNPSLLKKGDALSLTCTYDIYDKDGTDSEHLVRGNETATNSITIGASGSTIESIQVGKYYDFNLTINPDYLHVLSDHDNKHLSIE